MDEPRATCGDPVEELRPSQDFTEMTKPKVTSGDLHGAKLSKKASSFKLIEDLEKGGKIPAECPHDGPPDLDEREVLTDPCRVDIETLSISYNSMDSCVTITADTEEEKTSMAEHGHSQPRDHHGVDLLHGLPGTSSGSGGSQVGDEEEKTRRDEKELEVHENKELVESSKPLLEEDHPERECPICTELYDTIKHKQSLLNCNHIFCDNCIKTMVNTANRSNLCRLTCPICRQTTPMLEWEVHRMQEEMMESGGICMERGHEPPQPLVRRPGLCGALEYRFHKRFQTGRLFLFPPCIRNPQRLMERMTRLRHSCRCMYFLALVFLLFAEFFCFTFLFLPILVFILMIVLGK